MRTLIVLLVLLALPLASAATLTANYTVGDDVHVEQHYDVSEETIAVPIPEDATDLRVAGNASERVSTVLLSETATITYDTRAQLEGGDANYFVLDLSPLPGTISTVQVTLPQDARLVRDLNSPDPSIHPRPTQSETDGTHLIFTWTGQSLDPARALLISYERAGSAQWTYFFAALGLAALAGVIVYYTRRAAKQAKELTKNLYEDEKLLVELLHAEDGELWQKELVEKSGLSKVKVSRKLRNLETKGVIDKVPHGNTNKIRIKKD